MRHEAMNICRRDAVKMMIGSLAVAPLVNFAGAATALAQGLTRVDENRDPMAVALLYKHDGAASARQDPKQNCANCARIQANTGEWRPCELFKGRLVSATGWCFSWKAGRPVG